MLMEAVAAMYQEVSHVGITKAPQVLNCCGAP
jgi:hypothetical protein